MLSLDRSSKTPLYDQLYEQLREGIADGTYPAGSRLPSIRTLTAELRCSRNTVETAYRTLVSEGFAEAKRGSGYVVADCSRGRVQLDAAPSPRAESAPNPAASGSIRYDFTYRDHESGTFPTSTWKSLTAEVLLDPASADPDAYSDPAGETDLRQQIARKLSTQRGIHCDPSRIVVQNGTQQSMMSALALFDPAQDGIAMEDPGYDAVRAVFDELGFSVTACSVWNGEGAFLDSVRASSAKLAFVTPSSQFPTTWMMTRPAREGLIAWAHETGGYILEDDFCWEFCHEAPQMPAIFAIDEGQRTIYFGTFSKSLSPALRVSYLVLPTHLAQRWRAANESTYPAVAALLQNVLARYLADSRSSRNLRKLQTRCREKHAELVRAIREEVGDAVDVIDHGTGLHVLIGVRDGRSEEDLVAAALERGVRVYKTRRYFANADRPFGSCLLVGHSALALEDIAPGIRELASAWFGR